MRDVLEAVLRHPGDDTDTLSEVQRYTKLFWINNGPYNNLTAQKFVLKTTPAALAAAVKAAQQAGISIPKQLSIIGFDDVEPASLITPALTTLRTPTYEMGRQAVQQLELQVKLKNRRSRAGACVRLAPELIVRESTAKAIH